MHKNRLQEFAQQCNIALPLYETTNEGEQHAPRFRSKVWVDGVSYTSESNFSRRRTAEQDAARVALECLSKRKRNEAPSLVCEVCCSKIVGVGVDFSRCNFSRLTRTLFSNFEPMIANNVLQNSILLHTKFVLCLFCIWLANKLVF